MSVNKNVQRINSSIAKVLKKVDKCVSYEMLFCLEEDFNAIGMTLQPAKKDRMVLCTIVDGTPVAKRIFEDYIHIGSLENGPGEIPVRLIECIKDFVNENARLPSIPLNRASNWQAAKNGMYGEFVTNQPTMTRILESLQDDPVITPAKNRKKKTIIESTNPSKIAKTIKED
jgi:hypothetical protein